MFIKAQNSSKWQGKTLGEKYVLTLADMDFPLYKPFKQKLISEIASLNNLTYKNRSFEYFQSIKNWYRRHHFKKDFKNYSKNMSQFSAQSLIECPSLCNLIACCILAFTEPSDNVLIFTPVYSFYINSIKQLQRKVVFCQFKQAKANEKKCKDVTQGNIYRYEFDSKDFEDKMSKFKPKLIILCHPHNPTGKILSRKQLDLIVQKAKQLQTYILSDEIMGDFTLYPALDKITQPASQKKPWPTALSQTNPPQQKPLASTLLRSVAGLVVYNQKREFHSLVNWEYDKIIIGNSISKVFNCESVQGGYGIIRSQIVRNKYNSMGVKALKHLTNQLSLILTPIIYSGEDAKNWITHVNTIVQTNFRLLTQAFIDQKGIKIYALESSYLTIIQFDLLESEKDKTNLNKIAPSYYAQTLEKFGLYFMDIKSYFIPTAQRNIFRLAIAISTSQFVKFLVRFKQSFEQIKQNTPKYYSENNLTQIKRSKL